MWFPLFGPLAFALSYTPFRRPVKYRGPVQPLRYPGVPSDLVVKPKNKQCPPRQRDADQQPVDDIARIATEAAERAVARERRNIERTIRATIRAEMASGKPDGDFPARYGPVRRR